MSIHTHRILILDFGSQYTQLIARRVREIGVYSEILPFDVGDDVIRDFGATGIVLSGGPESVAYADSPRIPQVVFDLGVPLLGICYGMQAMASHFGGVVSPSDEKEFGYAEVAQDAPGRLLDGIEDRVDPDGQALLDVWMSHGDKVTTLPEGFKTICTTASAPIAGMGDDQRRYYGLQFHPEVTHTVQGRRILERFVHDICGCEAGWTTAAIIDDQIARVREQVGKDTVLLGLSGGVDSSVVAALLHEAIGDQLLCIFVDTGLLRYQEGDQVMATFAEHLGVRVERINARDQFMNALAGVSDPEEKRKIIGREFIRVFEQSAKSHQEASWLAQGTIYPDVIESAGAATGKAKVIKSHHNVGGLPEDMNLKLVEPLKELFKDEVREIGIELGLPRELVMRHPFPGPGLGVRILGEVKPGYVEPLQKADHIFISELRKAGFYDKVSQAFAVFLPVKSVGVVGDARRYEYVIALRAVETIDFMTARWAYLDHDFLDHVSRRIINECDGVSRVVYDISGKPPATIEWE
ncbi:glutamine-hydrolyzing GMP synthase [Wenzhouxiangella sp. AB-CW3]|uniref:glutamine-hydrolyzing GMP synthase n=1 Tax=Wenzhouxiangella sp. AB-CW3 TaxID=2771012 RepID=UPI00168B592F|nr:glutamine-hydrolyzing GMP synthase [Wenzhouxiangella sp. AB-CW3]QOC23740.1 glutamine-hydrolyzing GMP synthase [Wenzhouxiangella sp. AB-CW3]